jgi:hypothetical protein
VIGIVQPDADELAGSGNAGAKARAAADDRQAVDIELLGPTHIADRVAADIGDHAAQVPDLAILVEDTRLFRPKGSVPQKFHVFLFP